MRCVGLSLLIALISIRTGAATFEDGVGADKAVHCLALQSDGKIIAGGEFSSYAGIPQNGLARLNPDGSLDTNFNIGTGFAGSNPAVSNVFVLPSGRIIAAGGFTAVNGVLRNRVARLLVDGTIDPSFDAQLNTWEYAIGVQKDEAVIIAEVTQYKDLFIRKYVATTSPGPIPYNGFVWAGGCGGSGVVRGIAGAVQADGNLLLGGDLFTRCLSNGSAERDLVPAFGLYAYGVGAQVFAFQADGKTLVGGTFTNAGGVACVRLGRFNSDLSLDPTFSVGAGPDSAPRHLLVAPDGKILVCGAFTNFNGQTANYVTRLNPDGSRDASFDLGSGPDAPVNCALLLPDGGLLLGGEFTSVNGLPRSRICHIPPATSGPPQVVQAPPDLTISVGRNSALFVTVSGQQPISFQWLWNGSEIAGGTTAILPIRNVQQAAAGIYTVRVSNALGTNESRAANVRVLRAPVSPGSLDAFNFSQIGGDCLVSRMAVETNGNVIICGLFRHFDGLSRNYVARVLPTGNLDTSFDLQLQDDATVQAVAIQLGNILIGGSFTNVGSFSRNCIARVKSDGTVDPAFNPRQGVTGNYPFVQTIFVMPDNRVMLGGRFWNVDQHFSPLFARLTPDGAFDPTFDGIPMFSSGNTGTMLALSTQSTGKAVLLYSTGCNDYFARAYFNGGGPDGTFQPGPPPSTFVVLPDDRVVLTYANRLVRTSPDRVLDPGFDTSWLQGFCTSLLVQPDGKILASGDFSVGGDVQRHRIVRLNADGTCDDSFRSDCQFNGRITQMAFTPSGSLLVCGEFTEANGCTRNGIAMINMDLRIESWAKTSAQFGVTLQTSSGKRYYLESSTSLATPTWASGPPIEGDGSAQQLLDPSLDRIGKFYRVRVE